MEVIATDASAGALRARSATVPWYVGATALAATSVVLGVIWDISWHRTIGRDSFWTPAHMAIYLGGVVGGLSGGWLALKTTFAGTTAERALAVRFWGFRAPLGAWIAIWGAIAMITSAPFDDWWHNAYGLDVEILSPPHVLLALGMFGVVLGALLLVVAFQNRAGDHGGSLGLAFAYGSGVMISLAAVMATDYRWSNEQHAAQFYLVACGMYPIFLVATARACRIRWPATTIAASYMLLNLVMIWILPLFRGEPLLAPIYRPVDRMVVDTWPLLLIAPGIALDLVMRWWGEKRDWHLAPMLAVVFLGVLLLVQWNFSAFLISDRADNWFFAGDRLFEYGSRPGDWEGRFWNVEGDPITAGKLGLALALAFGSTRLGLWWGNWMRRVKR